jgi:hypothetical protein
VFTVTVFVAAWLLFAVQPMITKMLLPSLGGSAAVWNTAMVFFQAVLVGGYLFAHISTTRLPAGTHRLGQMAVLILPVILLPIALPGGWRLPTGVAPPVWTLFVLAIVVGAPFFALSTVSPTLQRWFSQSGHPDAADPYFLYAAGNAGSLLALAGYPFLIEPNLGLGTQTRLWTAGYVLMLGLAATSARLSHRSGVVDATDTPSLASGSPAVSWKRRAFWTYAAFVPSVLMLAVTRHLATDVASIPLLWVGPLSIYLFSFVVTFRGDPTRTVQISAVVLAVGSAVAVALRGNVELAPSLQLGIPLVVLAAAALVAHGRVVMDRPPADRLTDFYLWISVGGVAGGVFASLLVPAVFDDVVEYPIAIALALTLTPRILAAFGSTPLNRKVLGSLALATVVPVLALTAFVTVGTGDSILLQERTFFGVYRVLVNDYGHHVLLSGTTIHGQQDLSVSPPEPMDYYVRSGPIGQVIEAVQTDDGVLDYGIIGLGAGELAAYGRPSDHFTFYEIDPAIVDIALRPDLFTYIAKSQSRIEFVVGDGRIELARSENQHSLIVVDAFASDAIPVHLLTVEALKLYFEHLKPEGMLAVHISNRFFDLEPVLGRATAELGLSGLIQLYQPDSGQPGASASQWAVIARSDEDLTVLAGTGKWRVLPAEGPMWTDDHADVISVLNWW